MNKGTQPQATTQSFQKQIIRMPAASSRETKEEVGVFCAYIVLSHYDSLAMPAKSTPRTCFFRMRGSGGLRG